MLCSKRESTFLGLEIKNQACGMLQLVVFVIKSP